MNLGKFFPVLQASAVNHIPNGETQEYFVSVVTDVAFAFGSLRTIAQHAVFMVLLHSVM